MKYPWWSIAMLGGVWLSGCSDPAGDGQAPDDSSNRSKAVAQLSAPDYEAFCDAVNLPQGGYGKQQTCSDGNQQHTDADQSSCFQALTALAAMCAGGSGPSAGCVCALTVGQTVDCAVAQGTDLCRDVTVCEPIRRCLSP